LGVRLLRDSFPDRPALDIALSHALLARVAGGDLGATVRLYRPGPTLAFGRLDTLRPGFAEAGAAARDDGFDPIVRLAGGHAAAYHEESLIYEEITPQDDVTAGLHDRFRDGAELLASAIAAFGVDARVGEIPGEYCPGAYTVSAAGRIKLVGTAQRAVRGGALLSAFVLVGGGERLRAALFDVYRALELSWDPATAGALDDAAPGVSIAAVEAAILGDRALTPARIDNGTLALARELEERHRWPLSARGPRHQG
jgi:octanoyl-[GcvH]:protein N-octanoyltransferase